MVKERNMDRRKPALERYLATLVERHRLIDARIAREARWSPRMTRLKRLRLALKDRIAALARRGLPAA
jgi:hypothetical protein